MKTTNHILCVILLILLSIPCFPQDTNTDKAEKKDHTDSSVEKSGRAAGLRKLTNNSDREWNFDIEIDEEALEAGIGLEIENAMKSMEQELENLNVQLEILEANIPELNIDIEPVKINLPDLDINIEPMDMNLDNLDINVNRDFDWDDAEDNDENDSNDDGIIGKNNASPVKDNELKEKDEKNKSYKKEKQVKKTSKKETDKSKGLKKIN